MYLFCSQSDQLFEETRLVAVAKAFGRLKIVRSSSGTLVWIETSMSTFCQTETMVHVELNLPANIDRSINSFHWDLTQKLIEFSRDWRGVFSTYFSRRAPIIVTSHKKLVPLLLKKSVPLTSLKAGASGTVQLSLRDQMEVREPLAPPRVSFTNASRDDIADHVRHLVIDSMQKRCMEGMALLLSGGVDSTILAAVARRLDLSLKTFTFALRRPSLPDVGLDSDRSCAAEVSARYGHRHHEILLDDADLVDNISISAYLGETARSTIVDELPAHIAVARLLHSQGIRQVLTGEAADDLFGAFPSALRFYCGQQLRSFLQLELMVGLPDELAIVQNIYSHWGISLILPYWTEELRSVGYWLPVKQRIDKERLMKTVLRRAFADIVPQHLVTRPKGVPRDCTQIRGVLESAYGRSSNRYRSALSKMMERNSVWREKQLSTLRNN
jgi:asparagine synthetase B (glutamine-hydrolysing)